MLLASEHYITNVLGNLFGTNLSGKGPTCRLPTYWVAALVLSTRNCAPPGAAGCPHPLRNAACATLTITLGVRRLLVILRIATLGLRSILIARRRFA